MRAYNCSKNMESVKRKRKPIEYLKDNPAKYFDFVIS